MLKKEKEKLEQNLKKPLLIKSFILYFLISFNTPSHAYLDPGLGSYILSIIALGLATGLVFIRSVLSKIKNFFVKFKNLFKKKDKTNT